MSKPKSINSVQLLLNMCVMFWPLTDMFSLLWPQVTVTTAEDAGTFVCRAQNREGTAEGRVELTVMGGVSAGTPPQASVSDTDLTAVEGRSVTMHCHATGKETKHCSFWNINGGEHHYNVTRIWRPSVKHHEPNSSCVSITDLHKCYNIYKISLQNDKNQPFLITLIFGPDILDKYWVTLHTLCDL